MVSSQRGGGAFSVFFVGTKQELTLSGGPPPDRAPQFPGPRLAVCLDLVPPPQVFSGFKRTSGFTEFYGTSL